MSQHADMRVSVILINPVLWSQVFVKYLFERQRNEKLSSATSLSKYPQQLGQGLATPAAKSSILVFLMGGKDMAT